MHYHKFYAQILCKINIKQLNACTYVITLKAFTLMLPKINNNKHVICQLYNTQLQKEVKSNPKTAQL